MKTRPDLPVLLGNWSRPGVPMGSALADRLGALIDDGFLPVGTQLPAERSLALALGVSRTTVTAAYDRLRELNLVESRSGRGTWIGRQELKVDIDPPGYGLASDVLYADSGSSPAVEFDLTWAALQPGPWLEDALPKAVDHVRALAASHPGYEPAGIAPLRDQIARILTPQAATNPDQLLVTSGGTQAISLTIRSLTSPGSTVLVEELTCPTALSVFRSRRVKLVPIPMDQHGIRLRELEAAIRRHAPSMVYLTPTFHNPTGGTLPAERRHAIAELAQQHNVPLVEDLSLNDLALDNDPPPPIFADTAATDVYSIGSLSKLYWPGLRLGWIRMPRRRHAGLARLKAVDDFGTSLTAQCLAIPLLERHDEVKRQRRQELTAKRATLLAALIDALPDWDTPSPRGGLSLWATAPVDLGPLRQRALRQGIILLTDQHFRASSAAAEQRHVRIPYTMPSDRLIDLADRLGRAWHDDHGP